MVNQPAAEKHTFQAEIKRLLDILVHSLYTDRDIFLRELISNSSDALSKLQFQRLSDENIRDADAELFIEIQADPDAKQIRIIDTGIGMTHDELIENLGVIAQSGAANFVERMQSSENAAAADLIGQFGVGFYSVFMAAERVAVTSLSYQPDAQAYTWISAGEDTYEIVPAQKETRGTEILIQLREDATEYASSWKLRQIIKEHSDYISFPIYIVEPPAEDDADGEGETEEPAREPVNQQTAIWRRSTSEVEEEAYKNYYRQLTLDFEDPLLTIHARGDAPIQYYALLFVPATAERNMLSPRKQPGLKLYTRKVLIEEYNMSLLPDYLQFVQGVVDSEDLPLNVSRESIQANPVLTKLKQVVTRKVLSELKKLADNAPERYAGIWREYGTFLKHGIVSQFSDRERLLPLLRFHSSQSPDELTTLDDYIARMGEVEGQEAIYYLAADSVAAAARSPHLDPFRARGIEVLYMTDHVDGFLVSALDEYEG
ncbi:MAG: molecular chaperone HtpG, partial [Anaerolineales bacterium]